MTDKQSEYEYKNYYQYEEFSEIISFKNGIITYSSNDDEGFWGDLTKHETRKLYEAMKNYYEKERNI